MMVLGVLLYSNSVLKVNEVLSGLIIENNSFVAAYTNNGKNFFLNSVRLYNYKAQIIAPLELNEFKFL
jgi:hypothetical protein